MSLSPGPAGPRNGSGASPGSFERRAAKVLGNAAAYELLQDLAGAVDRQNERLDQIHAMCTTILAKIA